MSYKVNKLKDLFLTKNWADCSFLIDNEKIEAHKLILACSSPVFESMLYGHLATNVILVEDISARNFKKMIEFIYTDTLILETISDAWELFYASQKYFLYDLQEICKKFIKSNMNIENLLLSYEFSVLYNDSELLEKCLQDVINFAKGLVLYSNYHMKPTTLQKFLNDFGGKNMSAVIILTLKWCIDQCDVIRLSINFDNIYNMLKNNGFLEKLNFDVFDFVFDEGIVKAITKSQLFNLVHVVDMCELFKKLRQFNQMPNNNCETIKTNDGFLYRVEYKNCMQMGIIDNLICSTVCVNRNVIIFGMAVTTRSTPRNYKIDRYVGYFTIYIYLNLMNNMSELIYKQTFDTELILYDSVECINFTVPVLLETNKKYIFCVDYVQRGDNNFNDTVLLKYMSDNLKKGDCVINFDNESIGSIVRGLSFYEA